MPVRYDFAALQQLSAVIMKAHGEVDQLRSDIRSSSATLKADWDGSASDSWTTVQTRWDQACDALTTTLNKLSVTVQENGSSMQDTETSNANLFNA